MNPVYGGECDFHLFSPLKERLGDTSFADEEDVENEV